MVSRYLLINSGCVRCSRAGAIAEAASGRIEVRALDDPEFAEVVASHSAGHRAKPLLVVRGEGGVFSVFSGPRLALALAVEIGPAATVRVLRTISGVQRRDGTGMTRRAVLRRSAMALGGVLFGVRAIEPMKAHASATATGQPVREAHLLAALHRRPAVRQAEAVYGDVDWDTVELHSQPAPFYVLRHRAATLFVGRDLPIAYVLAATPDGTALALEAPTGRRVGVLDVNTVRLRPAAAGPAELAALVDIAPDVKAGFWNCFYNCIGRTGIPQPCHQTCIICAQGGRLSGCHQCIACVGLSVAGTCAIDCWKEA